MATLGRIFLAGLATLLPMVITVWLVVWLAISAERGLGEVIRVVLPEDWYLPGMGLIAAIGLVFAVGLLARNVLLRRLFALGEAIFNRIPLVKTLYGAIRDLVQFVAKGGRGQFNRVVMVSPFGSDEVELVGFVTREDFDGLPEGIGREGRVAVYLPMSYQIGGYTLYIPTDRIRPIDMSMEDAMRFAVTAGMSVKRDDPG